MSYNALYTDLSGYYDLMCADINYYEQSYNIRRIHQLFGNSGTKHLDLACGTGPHIEYLTSWGYQSWGLDINQPMLDMAQIRCPNANFTLQNMCDFKLDEPQDLITCFLYSIHYNDGIEKLKECIANVHAALNENGMFCFNAVDKTKIDNRSFMRHSAEFENSNFTFQSGWNYCGEGERQSLQLSIEKTTEDVTEVWQDQHPMVAVSFPELKALLEPYFEVHILEHDYNKIIPWDKQSGNAIFACIKN
ncbi:class I SAM-dependent methyltransferase [Photobacterium damselae subsp. damselae]|uniref:class I SAM-dependent DNA methyltransferase n=1 Tax=Photobacterium damselae TaxID=38293 RepID=UPI001F15D5E7|nr:class I SAM-dependent methyltransferase [Photobacterium damselae]UKA27312.1 class I SAM-dependent methyltransferase [Photobacterium damselae subsp. damselae]